MASHDRLIHDVRGRIFIPINVDQIVDNDSFLTLPKGMTLAAIAIAYIATIIWGGTVGLTIFGWILVLGFVTIVSSLLLRYIVFQEPYFYKLWKREQALGTPKASRYWGVSSIRKTPSGDILVFQDLKVGCIIELERDTIIGRAVDNKERHYDAWSDFYRALFESRLSLVQMNFMQPAGRDERFNEMADMVSHVTNKNVKYLLERNTGYMKAISSNTLDEHDYLLIYTQNINKMDTILSEAAEAVSYLMGGAYVGARVLTERDIYALPRENFNVGMFDGVEAQMNVYRGSGLQMKMPFKIKTIYFEGGKKITMTNEYNKRLEEAIKLLNNEQISYYDWSVTDALRGKWSGQYSAAAQKKSIKYDDGEEVIGDDGGTSVSDEIISNDIDPKTGAMKRSRPKKEKKFLARKSSIDKDAEIGRAEEAEKSGDIYTEDEEGNLVDAKGKKRKTKTSKSKPAPVKKKGKTGFLKRKKEPEEEYEDNYEDEYEDGYEGNDDLEDSGNDDDFDEDAPLF